MSSSKPFPSTLIGLLLAITLACVSLPIAAQIPQTDSVSGAVHFTNAERARALYAAGQFPEAESLLTQLVQETPYDGSLWFVLARSQHRQGKSRAAIAAYRSAFQRGHSLEPYTAYQLARLYAGTGAVDSALAWLERALALRWEERPEIATDTAFARLRGNPRFIRAAAIPQAPAPSRNEAWRRDLDYLVAEAKRMHVGPERPAHSPRFDSAAAALGARISELSNELILLEMQRLIVLLGDGHSAIYGPGPDSPIQWESRSLPLQFREFSDGVFVIDAAGDARRWIGAEVLRFGAVPASEAVAALASYVNHDNAMTVKWLGIHYGLPSLNFLHAIGATDAPTDVVLTLRTPDGAEHRVRLDGGDHVMSFSRKLRAPPGIDVPPLYLSRVDENYWLTALPEGNAVYFQFNQVRNAQQGPSIAAFADSLRRALTSSRARNLIVDVRHNNGGNNSLFGPLLRTMVWWETDAPGRRIYVITGRNTFSAAQNFINQVERMTDAVFVGEPSSSRPNFAGEETNLTLPYSRIRGSISTRYWQDSDPGDARPFIAPDLPVGLTAAEYFAGQDPALAAVSSLTERGGVPR